MKKIFFLTGIALMLVACIITYSNHFHNDFHFDDSHTIVNNPNIRDIHNCSRFFTDGSTSSVLPQNQSYRPLTTVSLAFDYWLGKGYNLFYFHLSTFILFLIQGILMVFLYLRIFDVSADNKKLVGWVALIGVTWYMLHPVMAETVNYIIARADLQSTMFVVLAFVLYQYSSFCRKTWLYLLPIVLGALAKPPAIMFAPLFFIYVLFFEEKLSLYAVFEKRSLGQVWKVFKTAMPAFICCAFMYWWQAKLTPKTWEPGGNSPLMYLVSQPFVILHYFQMCFVPNGLSADSDWQLLPGILDWRFFIGCFFIFAMIAIAFATSVKAALRPISFGILWFFITLVPTSSIIPLAEVLNDHRMFIPFVGLCLSISWSIGLLLNKISPVISKNLPGYKAFLSLLFLFILSGYAYATYNRNKVWHTEDSLWYDVTIKSPLNGRGLMNYGLSRMSKGDYKNADIYFSRALKILPYYSSLQINIAVLKEATGDPVTAEAYYLKGIQYGPSYPDSYYFYARFLANQRRFQQAVPQLIKGLSLSPSYFPAHQLLMATYDALNDWSDLQTEATTVLKIAPGNADAMAFLDAAQKKSSRTTIAVADDKTKPTAEKYLNLSLIYYNAGRYQDCIDAANQALKLNPGFAEAYNNIGSANNMLKQYDKAIEALKRALSLKPGYQLAINNLAMARTNKAGVQKAGVQAPVATPKTADDFINQSLGYFNSGQYQQCIYACYKALKLKPGYDLAYNNICASYNKLGQYDKAIAAGQEGLKINPGNQLLKNNLAESIKGKENAGRK